MSLSPATARERFALRLRDLGPGIVLALGVAAAAAALAPVTAIVFPIPAMVLALIIGIAINGLAASPVYRDGLAFCVKRLLRVAVALLGVRIALGDIAGLGLVTAGIVIVSMGLTIVAGLAIARFLGQTAAFGALAGAATAVCGASATLATATVLPSYKGKEADIAFVVVAVNALSTVAMVAYPALCLWLGLDAQTTGILLGATIHDVAQVVGAGYAVSDEVGNTATVVKLFRVFLLLPVVLAVGWWFARAGAGIARARVPIPVFAVAFLALCIVNTVALAVPASLPVYLPIKYILVEAATWGLLIAIAALGLGTSLTAIAALGWRHTAAVSGTTLVILVVVTAALVLTS